MTLTITLQHGFAKSFEDFRRRVHTMADKLTAEQFWSNPFGYGNSFGNLVLHITGNLNYYIGTQIHGTGYVRTRELEFAPVFLQDKTEALRGLDEAVAMVIAAIGDQSEEAWSLSFTAVGVDDLHNRFEMFLRAAAHFHHHIGQMTYIVKEWQK